MRPVIYIALSAMAIAGCNKPVEETINNTVGQATQVVQQTVENVKQEANLVGSMELATNPPIAAKACYAKLFVIDDGRPNVFRLASYKSDELERFPSIMLQAQVNAESLSGLQGQTVKADVFARTQDNGLIWHSPAGSPASITISAIDDKSLTCTLSGPIVNSDTEEESNISGKFIAMLEE